MTVVPYALTAYQLFQIALCIGCASNGLSEKPIPRQANLKPSKSEALSVLKTHLAN